MGDGGDEQRNFFDVSLLSSTAVLLFVFEGEGDIGTNIPTSLTVGFSKYAHFSRTDLIKKHEKEKCASR